MSSEYPSPARTETSRGKSLKIAPRDGKPGLADFVRCVAASNSHGMIVGLCLFLVAITWFVFGQTIRFPFVDFDDPHYIYENPQITRGLSATGIVWAFTHVVGGNWHPLTTISHMLDCQLFGLNAGGHHFTNVLLHTIAVVLLFLVLRNMTSSANAVAGIGDAGRDQRSRLQHSNTTWRSVFVAAVFAIHPLRAESVAWIAERKDVLSAVFFMLTLLAYVHYTRKKTFGSYLMMSILFAAGLMSKPMLVTVPIVLLLLDYWPLGRVRNHSSDDSRGHLVLEKIPLFILSAACALATVFAQQAASMQRVSLFSRLANAVITYVIYIWQMLWPQRLAVFYPFAGTSAMWQVSLAVVFLITVTAAAIWLRQRRPYFFVGWFWYLSMLVPVIGIVQVGLQAHADRYTYLPQIGLYVLLTWMFSEILKTPNTERPTSNVEFRTNHSTFGVGRWAFGVCLPVIMVAALAWTARSQAAYWRDSEVLWTHALAVTRGNYYAHSSLADLLMRKGQLNEAIVQSQEALRIRPDDADAENNLGLAYLQLGNEREAVTHFESSLKDSPNNLNARTNLSWVLATSVDSFMRDGQRAIELASSVVRDSKRENPIVLRTLAAAYAETGNFSDAIDMAQRAEQAARATGETGLAVDLERNIESYRLNQPIRSRPR